MPPRATATTRGQQQQQQLQQQQNTNIKRRRALSDASNVSLGATTASKKTTTTKTTSRKPLLQPTLLDDDAKKNEKNKTNEETTTEEKKTDKQSPSKREKKKDAVLDELLKELDVEFQRKIDEVRARTLAAEEAIRVVFDTHSKRLSKIARNKRARDMKGYEESAFAIARREIVEEAEIMATGGDERGRESGAAKKRKASSREGDVGGKGVGEANADVATAPPLVETASVEEDKEEEEDKETTVIETLITENVNKVEKKKEEEKTEEHRNDKETEEEEFFEPSLVLKTDSGAELDIKNFQSSADVAPEQRRYFTFLQKRLGVILGVGSRSSD